MAFSEPAERHTLGFSGLQGLPKTRWEDSKDNRSNKLVSPCTTPHLICCQPRRHRSGHPLPPCWCSLWRTLGTRDRKSHPHWGKSQWAGRRRSPSQNTSGWRRDEPQRCQPYPTSTLEGNWRPVATLSSARAGFSFVFSGSLSVSWAAQTGSRAGSKRPDVVTGWSNLTCLKLRKFHTNAKENAVFNSSGVGKGKTICTNTSPICHQRAEASRPGRTPPIVFNSGFWKEPWHWRWVLVPDARRFAERFFEESALGGLHKMDFTPFSWYAYCCSKGRTTYGIPTRCFSLIIQQ